MKKRRLTGWINLTTILAGWSSCYVGLVIWCSTSCSNFAKTCWPVSMSSLAIRGLPWFQGMSNVTSYGAPTTKSLTYRAFNWWNSILYKIPTSKIPNGQRPERAMSRIGRNPNPNLAWTKFRIWQNPKDTKSRIEQNSNQTKSEIE